ncbi:MAG: HD domain-containing protein [Deltaproteobacteria bacterium]|nr:HD domain-containing protein [Deltaproteobacteria bacterium]
MKQIYWTLDAESEVLTLEHVATALNRIYRFGGRGPTVLEHSLQVCDLLPEDASPQMRLAALVHDIEEVIVGDINGRLRKLLGPEAHAEIAEIRAKLMTTLGIPPLPESAWMWVHEADGRAYAGEVAALRYY